MRRTDTVCSPGVLRRLLAIADDQPLGEGPIPANRGRKGRHQGEWRHEANGQWRFWQRPRRVPEDEIAAGVPAKCSGCGARYSLAALKKKHPRALSCCPERDMREASHA